MIAALGICVDRAPSILILDNLDALSKSTYENNIQNGEYFNYVSEVIKHVISAYSDRSLVSIIATIAETNNLNERMKTYRGNPMFCKMFKISELTSVS